MNSLIWIILAILAGIIELLSFNLVSIWFSISAIVLAIISIYIKDLQIQIFIFSVLSLLFLILTRNLVKKFFNKRIFESDFIGTKVKVIDREQDYYLVKFKGVIYKAVSNKKIEIGTYKIIKKFDGNKIILED